jgi:hypothetical protein
MKTLVRIASLFAVVFLILVASAIIYSTEKGYTAWFVRIPDAVISVNGARAKGWVDSASNGRAIFFTRADSAKPVTYDLVFRQDGKGLVLSCGSWVAPRLAVFPVGDVNPPCFFEGSAGHDVTREPRSVAFTTNEGARVEARW